MTITKERIIIKPPLLLKWLINELTNIYIALKGKIIIYFWQSIVDVKA